jgi:hypothetical protein
VCQDIGVKSLLVGDKGGSGTKRVGDKRLSQDAHVQKNTHHALSCRATQKNHNNGKKRKTTKKTKGREMALLT